MVHLANEGTSKDFLGSVIQPLFIRTFIEKGQVITRYADNGELMAYLVWNVRHVKAKPPYIMTKGDFNVKYVAVGDKYKRQGHGSSMVEDAIEIAKELRSPRIVMQVRTDNVRMIGLGNGLFDKIANTGIGTNGVEMHEFVIQLEPEGGLL